MEINVRKPLPMSVIKLPGHLYLPPSFKSPVLSSTYAISSDFDNWVESGYIPRYPGFYYVENYSGYFYSLNHRLFRCVNLINDRPEYLCRSRVDLQHRLIQGSAGIPLLFQYIPLEEWVWTGLL